MCQKAGEFVQRQCPEYHHCPSAWYRFVLQNNKPITVMELWDYTNKISTYITIGIGRSTSRPVSVSMATGASTLRYSTTQHSALKTLERAIPIFITTHDIFGTTH